MSSVVRLFKSLQSNFCSRRSASLSVLGSGRRVLLAPTSSTTGFPGARGTELVETRCSGCLPGVAAHRVTQFSVRFLSGFSRAFRSSELREREPGAEIGNPDTAPSRRLVLSESLLLIQVELRVLVQNGSQIC